MDLASLFNSTRRYVVLQKLCQSPDGASISDVALEGEVDKSGVLRELRELEKLGVVLSKEKDSKTIYFFQDSEQVNALKQLVLSSSESKVWFLLEELPNGYFSYQVRVVVDAPNHADFYGAVGASSEASRMHGFFERKNNASYLYADQKAFDALAKKIVSNGLKNPDLLLSWLDGMIAKTNAFRDFNAMLRKTNFSKESDKKLASMLVEGEEKYFQIHLCMWVQCIDLSKEGWTNTLQKLLKEKNLNTSLKLVQEAFAVLTTPSRKSLGKLETENLNLLVNEARKNPSLTKAFEAEPFKLEESLRDFPKFIVKIDDHVEKYGFLTYGPNGPGNTRREYLSVIALMLKEKNTPAADALPDIEKYEKLFKLSESEKKVFEFLRKNVWFQAYRKDNMFEWWSIADRIFSELARRKNLTVNHLRLLMPSEFEKMPDTKELDERLKHVVFYLDGMPKALSGKVARDYMKNQAISRPSAKVVDEFYGNCACSGIARGKVTIVNTRDDIHKMEKGNILVSCATSPELMPAISKAAAIVTDMGGITCHASIVSRELGIPCIIGTGIATKVLKDGDMIEVNASHGRIKRLS